MNTTELNAAQIGSASTLPGIYIRGALSVYAASVAAFTRVGRQEVYAAALANVTANGLFGAIFNVQAKTEATTAGASVFRTLAALVSAAEVAALAKAVFVVGSLASVYGKASIFVTGRWTTYAKVAFKAVAEAAVNLVGQSGYGYKFYARTTPTAAVLEAGFTNFGEYAPDARFILVQTEDRKVVVV